MHLIEWTATISVSGVVPHTLICTCSFAYPKCSLWACELQRSELRRRGITSRSDSAKLQNKCDEHAYPDIRIQLSPIALMKERGPYCCLHRLKTPSVTP